MNWIILSIRHTYSKKIKRALAGKMILSEKFYHEVQELLKVSHSFISQWKNQALFHGVENLRLQLYWKTRLFKGTGKRANN